MRLAVFVITVFAVVTAKPTKPSTEDHRQYFLIPDEDGHLHLVNRNAIPRFVEPIDHNNITIYLYTPANPIDPVVFHTNELDKVIESGLFDSNRPSLFNTHGWTGAGDSIHMVQVKEVLLEKHNFNIFNIDWSGPAQTFYTEAVQYVNPVGDMIGGFINELIDYYGTSPSMFGLMGHSLGGQLIGRIGYVCNGELAYIIALDPAFPLFSGGDPANRLDSSDAQFVQVVHTNSGFLGHPDSIGHADFHPNGGIKQPGCGPDILGSCSHFLVKDMIAESYTSTFLSWKCDTFEEFLAGDCDENDTSFWGGWPMDTTASGDYFLRTNGESPFAIES